MNEVVIRNPEGDLAVAQEICRYIAQRKGEVLAAADAISITADNWNDPQTRDALEEFAEMVEDLHDRGKKLVAEVCAATEAQRVLTAIDPRLWTYSTKPDPECAYSQLKSRLDGLKAQVAAFKEAATPKTPARTFVVRIDATDKQFDAVAKAAAKCGAVIGAVAVAQSDAAVKTIQKWFEENK